MFSEKDTVVAKVAIKAVELAQSSGQAVVKLLVREAGSELDASVYMQDARGTVMVAYVRDKLADGRQFIDYEIYSLVTNDYEQWSASSLENFLQGVDDFVDRRKGEADAQDLTASQRATADNLFERYDFSYQVEDAGGWTTSFDGDDVSMTRAVYLQADEPDQDSIRSDFTVRFKDGTNVPHDVVCMLHGEEVGNITSGTFADYVVGEIVLNWATAPAAA
jgi:hypothetical protein